MTIALGDLRGVDAADAYKGGAFAATLHRLEDEVSFRYTEEWIERGGTAVATTLPVTPAPVVTGAGALPAFFTGLLPEGRRLGALRRAIKTSEDDELSLLLGVGADAVGDVQVVPAGVLPSEVTPRLSVSDIGVVRFADLLRELDLQPQRAALPGVQDTASAAMLNVPLARTGDRYILKLNPPEFRHLVENEAFFVQAAKLCGLSVPPHELVTDRDGERGLLVKRFDRVTAAAGAVMLAVEDGCQVLDRAPSAKYLVGSQPTFAALSAVCDAPVVAARELLRQLAFAYLTGNGDAHAKNLSVLRSPDGEWRVSPAYDLPSSQPYGDTPMAMSIGDRSGGSFSAKDFVALGAALDVHEQAVRRVLTDLTERVDQWIDRLPELPFDGVVVAKLRRVILYRRRELAR